MWRDEATLLDIVTAYRMIEQFVKDADQHTFIANAEKHWAVVSQLLIIGEAVTRLSDDFKSTHGTIKWREIAGMRNRLIHGYDKIRWELVWEVATREVPGLLVFANPLVPKSPRP